MRLPATAYALHGSKQQSDYLTPPTEGGKGVDAHVCVCVCGGGGGGGGSIKVFTKGV